MWSCNSVIHSVCKHWPTFSKIFSVWDYYLHSTINIYINQDYANVQKYSAGLHLSKVASTIPGVKKLMKGKMVKCFLGFPTFLTSPDSSSIAKTPTSGLAFLDHRQSLVHRKRASPSEPSSIGTSNMSTWLPGASGGWTLLWNSAGVPRTQPSPALAPSRPASVCPLACAPCRSAVRQARLHLGVRPAPWHTVARASGVGWPSTVVVPAGVRLLVGGWATELGHRRPCVRVVSRDEVRRDAERDDGGASGSGGMAVPCFPPASGRCVGQKTGYQSITKITETLVDRCAEQI